MYAIENLLFHRFKILFLLTLSMTLSIVLLMMRIKLNQSFYLLFLVWNLFLALIPFAITTYLASIDRLHKVGFFLSFSLWLLFLPNAPYIVTDLLHLMNSQSHVWLDVLVIMSFAFNGLILYFLSLSDMEKLLKAHLSPKFMVPIMIFIFGLSAFGIYLGRFFRYNSWELINNPVPLFQDIFRIIFSPNIEAWFFTLSFGSFLAISYWMLKAFSNGNLNMDEL
ncbi:DUF1361 domain-containing protein [Psychroserpens sp.]|uniref:DUF1361 domain-containing protein n=1 Tax=Psychroserpens sp. TaxID=2020870 RepID=UPI003C7585A9